MTNNIINPYEELSSLDKNKKRRVAFYGRVSTEHEAQMDALNNQLQWYDDQLAAHSNWVLHKKYIDRGITGTQARKRPAFLEMIEDAKKGCFDLIVTREVSRFARNTVDTLSYTRQLKQQYNIEVYFVIDNIWTFDGDGELRLTIMATLAQDESRKMSERVRAGQKVSRDNGVVYGNGNILGYDRVGEKYVINEEQAETVRKIFNLYLLGNSMSQIRDILTKDGNKTAGGGKWTTTNISRILNKSTYCGVLAYGQSYNNGYLEQKRFNNKNRNSYMYKATDLIPPIISQEDFERVQQIIKSRRTVDPATYKSRAKVEKKNIWTQKVKCGCGASVRMEHYTRHKEGICYCYRCYNQINNGSLSTRKKKGLDITDACDRKAAVDWKLELATYTVLKHVWGNYNDIFADVYNIIDENYTDESSENEQKKIRINQKIEKLTEKKERILEMRADGELTKEEFLSLKSKTDDEILSLSKELKEIPNEVTYNKEETIQNIKESLNQYIDFENQKLDDDIIREFVYRIYNMGDDTYIFIINLGLTESEIEKDSELKANIACYVSKVHGDWKNHDVTVSQDVSGELENIPLSEQQLHRQLLLRSSKRD